MTITVVSGSIYLEEEPRGDYEISGEGTSQLTVTFDISSYGTTVNYLILKFRVD